MRSILLHSPCFRRNLILPLEAAFIPTTSKHRTSFRRTFMTWANKRISNGRYLDLPVTSSYNGRYLSMVSWNDSTTNNRADHDDDDNDDDGNCNDGHESSKDKKCKTNHERKETVATTILPATSTTTLTSSTTASSPLSAAVPSIASNKTHQRLWFPNSAMEPMYWEKKDVTMMDGSHTTPNHTASTTTARNPQQIVVLASLLDRIEKQEVTGGRMRSKQCGVLHEDPSVDMRLLIENYTVNSLASALRDREEMLQFASQLVSEGDYETLQVFLKDCHPNVVLERRRRLRQLDLEKPLDFGSLEIIRKGLMRMPRRVTTAHSKRAGVVIALVHVHGVPSVLLEKRAAHLRAHPDEVCLPGGMVCEMSDRSIVETCLREMKEEIGGLDFEYHHKTAGSQGVSVLGILRCNWGEVHHLVGVAVTPVVCFFYQDLATVDLKPNPDEVAEVFTIPLHCLLDKHQWIYKDDHAPIFVGGPYVIWGLTGYILERFWKDILLPFHSKIMGEDDHPESSHPPHHHH